jgi:spermidine synthase
MTVELWFSEKHTPNVQLSIKVDRQLYSGRSDFQRIDVFDSKEFGRFLTLDGFMMLTEKDEFIYHGMITHVRWPCTRRPRTFWSSARATAAWCGS